MIWLQSILKKKWNDQYLIEHRRTTRKERVRSRQIPASYLIGSEHDISFLSSAVLFSVETGSRRRRQVNANDQLFSTEMSVERERSLCQCNQFDCSLVNLRYLFRPSHPATIDPRITIMTAKQISIMIFFWKNTNQTLIVSPLLRLRSDPIRSDQTARTTTQIDMHIHNKYSNNCIALSSNRIAPRAWKECLALKSSSICFLLFTPSTLSPSRSSVHCHQMWKQTRDRVNLFCVFSKWMYQTVVGC